MRILLLTNEYPPYIYGGAGVHVEYLSQELSKLPHIDVEVRSFHKQHFQSGQLTVHGTTVDTTLFHGCPKEFLSTLRAFEVCLHFNGSGINADITHCHTWYTHFGGILAKILYNTPLIITIHSLEPLRPWKREQIGHGYDLSLWVEKTAIEMADAIIAVSESTREDVSNLFNINRNKVSVIPNGIDINEYQHTPNKAILEKYNINPYQPYVLFVGRMTRQKGLYYLLKAIPKLDKTVQVVLCAGESDTPSLQSELEAIVKDLKTHRQGITWIPEMVNRQTIITLYSHATAFCCPSIYEPFGIINLEAMACGTPVIGSKVGGIAEVVVDNVTGILVDPKLSSAMPHSPTNPQCFSTDLAEAINHIVLTPTLRTQMSIAGRKRVEEHYSWRSIAERTVDLYKYILGKKIENSD